MAGTMTFTPKVVINSKSGLTDEVREAVASIECSKVVKNTLGGGFRVELKMKNGKPFTILAPMLDVHRGASTSIPKYEQGKRVGEGSAKPSMVLYPIRGDPGSDSLIELLNLLDERAKAICVEKITELESNKKLQTPDHIESVYNTWDKKSKARYAMRVAAGEAKEGEELNAFLRVKIMSRKDSDFHDPSNWMLPVKYIDEDGSIKKYKDASELKKGGMKLQVGLELNCVMKSSEGYSLDVQLREALILEHSGVDAEDDTALAEVDPDVASLLAKKRAAAQAKKDADETNNSPKAETGKAPKTEALKAPKTETGKKPRPSVSDDDSE